MTQFEVTKRLAIYHLVKKHPKPANNCNPCKTVGHFIRFEEKEKALGKPPTFAKQFEGTFTNETIGKTASELTSATLTKAI